MTTELSPDLKRLASDRDWFGYLTIENYEAVAARIVRLLDGKRYTWVAVNDGFGGMPEVRTGERITGRGHREGKAVDASMLAADHAHVMVSTTYGVFGLSSHVADQKAAHEASRDERESKRLVHLHFKRAWGTSHPDMLTIDHYAPAGYHLQWVLAVEPEPDEAEQ